MFQNQIQAQQAHYVKQQQQGIGYDFKTNPMHDSINALQGNFADLTLNKDAVSIYNCSNLFIVLIIKYLFAESATIKT